MIGTSKSESGKKVGNVREKGRREVKVGGNEWRERQEGG